MQVPLPGEGDRGGARDDRRQAQLLETVSALLNQAAAALEAETSWTLQTPMLLVEQPAAGEGRILPIGQLGQWLQTLPPALDGFVRLRQRGLDLQQAYAISEQEGGPEFVRAYGQALQRGTALLCHDDLARFASLSQTGFCRRPRELLLVVCWPERVDALLLSCQRQRPDNRDGRWIL